MYCVLGYAYSHAQTVVIKESPISDSVDNTEDSHWDGGFMFDITLPICETLKKEDNPDFSPTYSRSLGMRILANVKYKFNDEYAAVLHLGYSLDNFGFTAERTQTSFPDSNTIGGNTVSNERFSFSSITTGLGMRYTYDEEKFTEFGAMFNYAFSRSYQYEQKDSRNQTLEITSPSPSYLATNYSELYLRYGISGLSLVLNYRFTDLILATKSQPKIYQLPPFRVGICLGL